MRRDPTGPAARDQRPITRSNRRLGLAFRRVVVEAYGGKIWVEQADPGPAFVIRIYNAR